MGNIACCNQQVNTNLPVQQIILADDQIIVHSLLQPILMLSTQIQKNQLFVDFNKDQDIAMYIGIKIANLSQIYEFIYKLKIQPQQKYEISLKTSINKCQIDNQVIRSQEEVVEQIRQALFQMKRNTKKNIKSLNVNQYRNHKNIIQVPYFIPWLSLKSPTIYIGQWRFQQRYLRQNFPYGIGRLYFQNWIYEGFISTKINQSSEANKNVIKLILDQGQQSMSKKISVLSQNLRLVIDGQGRKFNKQQQYCGQFKNGKMNGKGSYKNSQQQYSFEGFWVDDKKNGNGLQKTKFTFFQGSFKQDKKQGYGILMFYISTKQQRQRQKQQKKIAQQRLQNNPEYEKLKNRVKIQSDLEKMAETVIKQAINKNIQNYKGGELFTIEKKSNQSFITNLKFEQGFRNNFLQKYVGQFSNDLFHGQGSYQWANGNFYIGSWVEGKMQGKGEFYWKQGFSYSGQYKNDLKHGYGEMVWDPYKRYRGSWAFGKKHAYGEQIILKVDNSQFLLQIKGCLWINNEAQKEGIHWKRCIRLDKSGLQQRKLIKNIGSYCKNIKIDQIQKIMLESQKYYKYPCKICDQYFQKQSPSPKLGYVFEKIFTNIAEPSQQSQPEHCPNCLVKMQGTSSLAYQLVIQ